MNISFQHEELLPLSTIETLSQGVFFGKVADNNDMKIKEKFFCGEIIRDLKQLKKKRKRWRQLPRLTDFGEDRVKQAVYDNPDAELMEYFMNELKRGVVVYSDDDLKVEARSRVEALSQKERDSLIESIAAAKAEKCIRDIIHRNFRKVQADVKGIIDKECWQPQDITPMGKGAADSRMVDPFA